MKYTLRLSDGVLNYSCAVLNDGLLIMELRDGICEGDGERIARCWKLMLLYFKSARRYKYSLEAFYITAMLEGAFSPRLHRDLLWSRVINSRRCAGHNIPANLHMEHLNRTLKDIIRGMGANVTEATIIQAGKSLQMIMSVMANFDAETNVAHTSDYHTKLCKDEELILTEFVQKSKVFDYVSQKMS